MKIISLSKIGIVTMALVGLFFGALSIVTVSRDIITKQK